MDEYFNKTEQNIKMQMNMHGQNRNLIDTNQKVLSYRNARVGTLLQLCYSYINVILSTQ